MTTGPMPPRDAAGNDTVEVLATAPLLSAVRLAQRQLGEGIRS
jgi:hypothetical protein